MGTANPSLKYAWTSPCQSRSSFGCRATTCWIRREGVAPSLNMERSSSITDGLMVIAGTLPESFSRGTASDQVSAHLPELGGERRGIGNAEVVQLHSSSHQVMLVDFVVVGESGQRDDCARFRVLVDAPRRIVVSG